MSTYTTTILYLAGDVARVAGCTPTWVRLETARGRLRVAAVSPRGVHLYAPEDVESYIAERATRRRRTT